MVPAPREAAARRNARLLTAMTWILLRGLTRESGHWGTFAGDLSSALGGERVVMVDLPGNGALNQRRSPVTVRRLVEECRVEVERRKVHPPFDIVAMSLGAMVAVGWAALDSVELQRCVLINTSLRPYSPFFRRLRPSNYLPLICTLIEGNAAKREQLVLQMTSNDAQAHDGVIDAWIAMRRARPVSRANAIRQLFAAARYRAPEARPHCDVLMLASTRDRLVDVRCSRAIARAWHVPLMEHASAGHDLPLDDPQWVIDRVRAWTADSACTPALLDRSSKRR